MLDPRVTPARPDLAAENLRGAVEAAAYAPGREMRVAIPVAPLTAAADAYGELTSQLLFGETFIAYEIDRGWAWGQAALDGYVGYTPEADLMPAGEPATHRVRDLQALVYPEPEVKTRPIGALPFGARIGVTSEEGAWAALDVGGWAPAVALTPAGASATDWVAEARRLIGAPYLWGGRSPAGVDCSGLIQIALQAAGRDCPRDSDQQMALGREAKGAPRRGDLVFWKGHVGAMTGPKTLLHANAHHMRVAEEPFETARARIAAGEYGEVVALRRLGR